MRASGEQLRAACKLLTAGFQPFLLRDLPSHGCHCNTAGKPQGHLPATGLTSSALPCPAPPCPSILPIPSPHQLQRCPPHLMHPCPPTSEASDCPTPFTAPSDSTGAAALTMMRQAVKALVPATAFMPRLPNITAWLGRWAPPNSEAQGVSSARGTVCQRPRRRVRVMPRRLRCGRGEKE